MTFRKCLAAAGLAGAVALTIAGCSDSDTASSTSSSAQAPMSSATMSSSAMGSGDQGESKVSGLSTADAQRIVRTAVDPKTSREDLAKVVDTTNPATTAAIGGFAKMAAPAGYGPDAYTATSVKADGATKATVTVSVKSPHTPQPVDLPMPYVKVDNAWKLSADAVNLLASMGGQHGGGAPQGGAPHGG